MKVKNCLIFGGSGQIGSLIRKLTKITLELLLLQEIFIKGLKIKPKEMQDL